MKASDVMTEGPASVRSTAPLREAIAIMQSLNVRHLPVVDQYGDLAGILSDRDLRKYSFSDVWPELSLDSLVSCMEIPVAHFMSRAVFAVEPETDAREIANLMIDQQIGAVPVITSDGSLVGIVSYVDLLRELTSDAARA
jgi:acetoin utilization protein AcuB